MIENITRHDRATRDDYQLSVFIPTWNNLDYLKLCVSSVKQNSSLSIQIIVFVNEGNDGTIEWLNEQGDIDFIHSTENAGICYALNLCRSMVKSEYIIYLNDDMYVLPNWDRELFNEVSKFPNKAFMISSTMVEPRDTKNPCVVVKNYGESIEEFEEQKLLEEYDKLTRNDWNGSTWPPNLVHIDLWDLVGGLSVEFSPGMYSDPDFTRKLYEAGVREFKGVGKSLVYHFGSKSTKKIKRSRGRELYHLKWGVTSNVFGSKVLEMGKPYHRLKENKLNKKDSLLGKLKIAKLLLSSDNRK